MAKYDALFCMVFFENHSENGLNEVFPIAVHNEVIKMVIVPVHHHVNNVIDNVTLKK